MSPSILFTEEDCQRVKTSSGNWTGFRAVAVYRDGAVATAHGFATVERDHAERLMYISWMTEGDRANFLALIIDGHAIFLPKDAAVF